MRGALEVRQSEFVAERHAGRRAGRDVLRHEGNRFGKRFRFGLMGLRLLASSVVFFASILALAESENTASAGAEERSSSAAREIDRAVVRFSAPEAGGEAYPQFIFERELAFEARLVALADPTHDRSTIPFRAHHLQKALERHIAERLMAALEVEPLPSTETIREQRDAALAIEIQQIGSREALQNAAKDEGLGWLEVQRVFRRRARASLYLDRMVAPMLAPTQLTLRRVLLEVDTPFRGQPFSEVQEPLRRWWVARRLREAVVAYYQNARARLKIVYLE